MTESEFRLVIFQPTFASIVYHIMAKTYFTSLSEWQATTSWRNSILFSFLSRYMVPDRSLSCNFVFIASFANQKFSQQITASSGIKNFRWIFYLSSKSSRFAVPIQRFVRYSSPDEIFRRQKRVLVFFFYSPTLCREIIRNCDWMRLND